MPKQLALRPKATEYRNSAHPATGADVELSWLYPPDPLPKSEFPETDVKCAHETEQQRGAESCRLRP